MRRIAGINYRSYTIDLLFKCNIIDITTRLTQRPSYYIKISAQEVAKLLKFIAFIIIHYVIGTSLLSLRYSTKLCVLDELKCGQFLEPE